MATVLDRAIRWMRRRIKESRSEDKINKRKSKAIPVTGRGGL
jgi:hypothetical protein